ncbi:serine/threonine protein kinase [Nocardia puris]|uniref:serine/threonine-protein kinase n=1 Tax=Nocardia puris TaxID=208602 RepID=UPI00189451AA|nr:serine/threonine-protein kinase [Nocardia puris]MBF6209907.1 serine/threonine protein kinase [Nocardia puris]MBF6366479.1 serine/threonine protein kinase [Nocardia puris]MBF6458182.1 serine/threonine protein kinase [Nocardia puris]
MTSDRLIAGRYRLADPIGTGAMGVVWRGTDVRLRRTVAVKQLLLAPGLSREQALESKLRAMREGRIAARLHHPNAITVFDVAEEDGQPWLVMEYLNAPSLAAKLSGKRTLPPLEVARIGAQAAAALAAAHDAGIMHRDVKPANLLVADDGTVKITDFGISRAVGDVTVTATGFLAGTPAYLAPEIARGENPEPASDVFALGSTLYAAVEGSPPFGEGDNPLAVLHAVARGDVPEPRNAGPLAPVLMRLLAAGIDARPTMREAAEALGAVAAGRVPKLADAPVSTKMLPAPGADATTVLAAPGQASAANADAATTFVPAPVAAVPPPAQGGGTLPGGTNPPRPSRTTVAVVAAAALVVILAGAVALASRGGDGEQTAAPPATTGQAQQPAESGDPGTPTVVPLPQGGGEAAPPPVTVPTTTPEPTSAAPSPTTTTEPTPTSTTSTSTTVSATPFGPPPADRVAGFIQGYYGMLPGNVSGAWSQLAPGYQAQTGGYAQYASFWSTIRAVRVEAISPSGEGAATVTLTYVKSNGSVESENRWVQVRQEGGRMVITASGL